METFKTFVLMPYGTNNEYGDGVTESDYVYDEIIEPGVIGAVKRLSPDTRIDSEAVICNIRPNITREVDKNKPGSITASIVESIASSDVVVVDITGRNPNVFLELGMRYAIRSKVTVLIAQEGTNIPFDIRGYRYIEYNKFKPADTRDRITDFIVHGLSEDAKSDSVVFDVIPSLKVTIPGIVESYGADVIAGQDVMPWNEYMIRIEFACLYLETALTEHRYFPDAIVGITNGGLIAADLIGKRVYAGRNTPVLSLWAKRHEVEGESKFWYFDNEYNDATFEGIKRVCVKKKPDKMIEILLIDDHMGTGSTAVQGVEYIKDRLNGNVHLTYAPIVSRRLDNIGVVEKYLPYKKLDKEGRAIFDVSEKDFKKSLSTSALYFPYLKKQVNVSTSG